MSTAELRESLGNNEVPGEALVWQKGMKAWLKAGDMKLTPNKPISSEPASISAYLGFLAVIALVSIFAHFNRGEIIERMVAELSVVNALVVFGSGMGLVSLAAIVFSVYVWNYRARRRGSVAAGILFCLVVCIGLFQIINFASFLIASNDSYRALTTIAGWGEATIVPIEEGVKIEGPIGTHLMHDFHAIEAKNGPVKTIEITSEGGLIDQALELAYEVKNRNLTVIVRGSCLSACVLVAVASPESYADEDALFGFHRTSPVAEFSTQISEYEMLQASEESRAFLEANGIPKSILVAAEAHGPESVHLVTAPEMVRFGAIKGIASRNASVAVGRKQ